MALALFPSLPRPLLFGHRGASAEVPENTLPAFERAVEVGVDVLELDVHLSRDGVVMVHHDATLERTTNGAGLLKHHDHAELARLDAGYRFQGPDGGYEFRGRTLRIPRLSEVLSAFPELAFNIEVKQEQPSMVAKVLDELERAGAPSVLLAAANHRIMLELQAAGTGLPLGLSREQCWDVWSRALLGRSLDEYRGRAFQVPPRFRGVVPVATRRVIRLAHAAGIEVHLWTLNDTATTQHWLSRGVDGIMSDDPASVIAAVRAARRGAAP